ncbi:MAG TPA: glycosyltransferase family 2 protein [Gemmatimonadaceae bacterium]|nr:glycosyltransferase family 2 protein [Gemmatimonadaceae bacterium]
MPTFPVSRPKLSVVIPVYNECHTLHEILRRVAAVKIDKEIVLVDDGSTDGTREMLQRMIDEGGRTAGDRLVVTAADGTVIGGVRIFFQDRNRGKGAAIRRGFAEAVGEVVIIQDADLEYDPAEYHVILDPIERGVADVVYGSRFLGAGARRVLFFWHSVGNRWLTLLSNIFTNLNLTDVWTCYKAFRREVLERMPLVEDRFGIEPEITAKVAKMRCRVYEVPISYAGRTYAEGKKIGLRDAVRGFYVTLRHNLLPSGVRPLEAAAPRPVSVPAGADAPVTAPAAARTAARR